MPSFYILGMKKLYALLSILSLGLSAMAQTTTVTVNATGAAGSYKTGNIRKWSTPTRNDDAIEVKYNASATATNGVRRGWAVFDLNGLVPPGASVTAANIRFTINTVANTANPTSSINAYAGDMSTITNITTVYNNCSISGNEVNTTSWGGAVGTITKAFNTFGVSFLNTYAATNSIVSFGFNSTSNANQIYTITGETGPTSQQPQLQITYSCTGVTATPSVSTPVCTGNTFTLSATATNASSYSWSGPAGFSSTDLNPAGLTASTARDGVYSLTATYNAPGGCSITRTVTVTSNPSPSAISGNLTPCTGTISSLGSSPAGGSWTINSTNGATLAGNMFHTGTAGTSTVTYTMPSGCYAAAAITTLDTPSAISVPGHVCGGVVTPFTSTPGGGIWTVNPSSVASINPATGDLTGTSSGIANITYTGPNGCPTSNSVPVIMPPAAITSSTGYFDLCNLQSLTLSNTVPGGTWSVSGGNATITSGGVITGVNIGTAPVTYTNTCGTATTTVNVVGAPPPITGVFSTCVNAASVLHDSSTGGIWSSSDPSIAAAAAGFGSVTGVSAGSVTISYTATSGCVVTTPFIVHPIPAPIQGVTNVCANGGITTLTNDSTGGVWSSANATVASVTPGTDTIRGLNAATTTITYTLPVTGCYVTTPFTVNPLPVAISGNNTVCALTSDTLYDLSLGGTWSTGNSSIAIINATTGVFTGMNASGGTTTITYTLPTGCIRTRSVIVRPLPNPSITYNGALNTLSTANYYTSYQWYFNGVAIPGAVANSVAATDNGSYNVYVTDTFGCENMSATRTIANVGVNDVNLEQSVSVVPNPTSGIVKIISPVKVNAVVTGLEGKVIMMQNNAETIDISALADGMYMVTLYTRNGEKITTKRVIKQQ